MGLMANCLVEKEKYAQAKPMLEYYLKLSPTEYRINSMIPLSICYFHLGEIDKGKIYLDSAQFLLKHTMYGPNEFKFLKAKSEYYKSKSDMDSAYLFLEAYNKKKELYEAGLLKNQSLLLLGRMEIDNRRTELKLTQKDLIKIKEDSSLQKKQLYLSLLGLILLAISTALILINYRQKIKSKNIVEAKNIELAAFAEINFQKSQYNEQLIKELHHRVKNNLQNVYSLLNIQKRRISDDETKDFVTSIQSRINSMAIVHESLYRDDMSDSVDFEQYVRNLIDHVKHTFEKKDQKIAISYAFDPVNLSLEKIILLGLIINESVSNVFKYLHTDRGNQLFISLQVYTDECVLSIRDDGPGFEPKKVNKTSLGLKLIKMMVKQLEASYSITSGNGVEHRIQFKI
jgi:two-component sensor histidine kinase